MTVTGLYDYSTIFLGHISKTKVGWEKKIPKNLFVSKITDIFPPPSNITWGSCCTDFWDRGYIYIAFECTGEDRKWELCFKLSSMLCCVVRHPLEAAFSRFKCRTTLCSNTFAHLTFAWSAPKVPCPELLNTSRWNESWNCDPSVHIHQAFQYFWRKVCLPPRSLRTQVKTLSFDYFLV